MPPRIVRFVLVLIASLLFSGSLAYAAAPTTTPQVIKNLTFEDDAHSFSSVTPLNMPGLNATAEWGRINAAHQAGSWSYWCAGASIPAGTSLWSTYPLGTRSTAYLPVPELSNYYSSSLSFGYLMPSLGDADAGSFNVMWEANSGSTWNEGATIYSDYEIPMTSATTWVNRSYDLGIGGDRYTKVPLSRQSGLLGFKFYDNIEAGGATAITGQGPAIDNVTVSGYMYGPVRSLATSVVGTAVHLAWRAPATSLVSSTDDARSIAYHVYRRVKGTTTWAEVTPAGGTTNKYFDDATNQDGTAYEYVVQAWSPSPGAGYGAVAPSVIGGRDIPTIQPGLTLSSSASSIGYGGTVTLTGQLKGAGGNPLPNMNVELQNSPDGATWSHDATLTSTSGTYQVTRSPARSTYFRLRYFGNATYFATDSASVRVTATPKITLGPAATTVAYAGTATLKGSFFNTLGALEPNKSVTLQYSYNNSTWYTKTVLTSLTGSYSTSFAPTRATYYRLMWAGDTSFNGAYSPSVKVTPKVYLTTPKGYTTVSRSRYYTYYGYVKPRQTAGTKPTQIKCYMRTSTGSYVLKKTYYATASNYSSYSKYSSSVRLPYAGRWRIRAYFPATSAYAATYSSYLYVTSK